MTGITGHKRELKRYSLLTDCKNMLKGAFLGLRFSMKECSQFLAQRKVLTIPKKQTIRAK